VPADPLSVVLHEASRTASWELSTGKFFFVRKYVNKASHRKWHMFLLKTELYTISRVTFIPLKLWSRLEVQYN